MSSIGVGEHALILSTFANGHLTQLGEYDNDNEEEKPMGALILAMQAVCSLSYSMIKLTVSGWPCTQTMENQQAIKGEYAKLLSR